MNKTLKMIISDDSKIFALQHEFNRFFPYLNIEFHGKPHSKDGAASEKFMKSQDATIADCRTMHNTGHIEITPSMTVADLKEMLQDTYGVTTSIFRNISGSRLDTAITNDWTLEKQNAEGESKSLAALNHN